MKNINEYIYNKKIELLLYIQISLSTLINILTMLKKDNIVSICFMLTFIVLLFCLGIFVFNHSLNFRIWGLLYLLFFIGVGAVVFSNNERIMLVFSYYKKIIMFISTLIFFLIITKIHVGIKLIRYLFLNIFIVSVCFILMYNFYPRTYYGGALTFNYTNPNLTAMILLHLILYCFIGILIFKNIFYRLSFSIVGIALIFFLNLTMSRTSLISFVFFVIIIILISIFRKKRINNIFISLAILFPYLFSIIYMKVIKMENFNYLRFMESEGKALNSRYEVWEDAFNAFFNNPLFGSYYTISNGSGMSQMHNTHLDILASYGILIFILTMIFLVTLIIQLNKGCRSFISQTCLLAFLTIIIMGFGEAAVFSGGIGLYILTGGFLLLTKKNNEIAMKGVI